MAHSIIEASLCHYDICQYDPSIQAAAAVLYAYVSATSDPRIKMILLDILDVSDTAVYHNYICNQGQTYHHSYHLQSGDLFEQSVANPTDSMDSHRLSSPSSNPTDSMDSHRLSSPSSPIDDLLCL